MANNKKVYNLGSIDTIPASIAGTGTITTNGVMVTGILTYFASEAAEGYWLFDAITNKEVRKIKAVRTDPDDATFQFITLEEAFTVDIAVAQAFAIVRFLPVFIGVTIPTGATGFLDGSAVVEKASYNWGASDKLGNPGNAQIDPVVAEPTGGTFIVTTLQ